MISPVDFITWLAGFRVPQMLGTALRLQDGTKVQMNRISAGIHGLAQLSCRGRFADGVVTTAGGIKVTTRHRLPMPNAATGIRLRFANIAGDSAGLETTAVAPIMITASFEYPLGAVPIQCTFGGQFSTTIQPGVPFIDTDPLPVVTGNNDVAWAITCVQGASYPGQITTLFIATSNNKDGDMMGWKLSGASNANPVKLTGLGAHNFQTGDLAIVTGVLGNTAANTAGGSTVTVTKVDATSITLNGVDGTASGAYTSGGYVLGSDLTGLGSSTMAGSGGVNSYGPIGVYGVPLGGARSAWLAILGDSIADGSGDAVGGWAGWISRARGGPTGCTVPFIKLARSGTKGVDFADVLNMQTKSARRRVLAQGAPYTISNHNTNDYGVNTLATLQDTALKIATSMAAWGARHMTCTLLPKTSTTDTWATAANQTPVANESIRTGYNDWVRDGMPIDATTKAPLAVGAVAALRAGQVGHPTWMVVDPTKFSEVNAANVLTVNGGRWLSNGTANYATTPSDNPSGTGTHPTPAMAQIISACLDVTKLVPFA